MKSCKRYRPTRLSFWRANIFQISVVSVHISQLSHTVESVTGQTGPENMCYVFLHGGPVFQYIIYLHNHQLTEKNLTDEGLE